MERLLVSACLVGHRVRYNGSDAGTAWDDPAAYRRWQAQGRLLALCPELSAGFAVPRPPAEVVGGEGRDVLTGSAAVLEQGGADVSALFLEGAYQALAQARRHAIRVAVLKEGSPSCGVHHIYAGNFSGVMKEGRGVTAELLERHGIRVFSERETGAVQGLLDSLEHQTS
ncbi:DUF523 domain-containing protein [Deinococcus sp.]|uniref:DUF523 domain-containing protein n=1 Tax=Deinococcus sp. TaxID=47478 RepID=UPI003CC51CCE